MVEVRNIQLTILLQEKSNIETANWGCEEYFKDFAKLVDRTLENKIFLEATKI